MHIEKLYDVKKTGISLIILFGMVALAGCSGSEESAAEVLNIQNRSVSAEEMGTAAVLKEPVIDLLEEEKREPVVMQEFTIYFGNGEADGLAFELAEMEELSAAGLIRSLSQKNIVSIDTKVQNFDELDSDGTKQLILDLNKSFERYLKTMGTAGERIIIAALSNTFLEAYGAETILITVDGKTLKSSHNEYENPISYMEIEMGVGAAE